MAAWILIMVFILLVLLGLVAIFFTRQKKTPPDYYGFFVIGLVWAPFGIIVKNYAFMVMGMVFMLIGLLHKDKWKQDRKDWSKLSKQERKITMALIIILGLLVLAGFVVLIIFNKGII